MRVVSLVPSVTETLLAWGVHPVAVTRFCEQPTIRHVGGTKDPDVDAVVALAPDLVVVNDEENRREDADALVAAGIEIHVVHIEDVAHVEPELASLRARLGLPPTMPSPVSSASVGRRPAGSLPDETPLRAFVPIWRRPWMTLGARTYGSSLLAEVGVQNVFADADLRYPTTTLEEAAARRPDVVLAPSEPYPFGPRHRVELEHVAPVVFVDGQDLFWWGVRTPAARTRLAELTRA